jgi:hypothetical protein
MYMNKNAMFRKLIMSLPSGRRTSWILLPSTKWTRLVLRPQWERMYIIIRKLFDFTSGAPAAVKRRAVDPVHTLKIVPVFSTYLPYSFFLIRIVGGGVQTVSTRHVGHMRHFVHHKSHLTRTGPEHGPPRWEASD